MNRCKGFELSFICFTFWVVWPTRRWRTILVFRSGSRALWTRPIVPRHRELAIHRKVQCNSSFLSIHNTEKKNNMKYHLNSYKQLKILHKIDEYLKKNTRMSIYIWPWVLHFAQLGENWWNNFVNVRHQTEQFVVRQMLQSELTLAGVSTMNTKN